MRPEQVLTVAQMRSAEQALIDGGETVGSLMQTAGQGAAEWVWRVAAGRPVTVLCGDTPDPPGRALPGRLHQAPDRLAAVDQRLLGAAHLRDGQDLLRPHRVSRQISA